MPISFANKKILVGITGGIAAYKTCELIRQLVKAGADVKAVITPSAKEFITETTLRTLTRNQVYMEQFNVDDWKPEHISLADSSNLFIIAPASANTIGKIANGICDNLLTSLIMAFKKPVIIAPAMNSNMWSNEFMQENLKKLEKSGVYIIPPESGDLACGYTGMGRMAEVEKIFEFAEAVLNKEKPLKNKRILITAGGTKEPIDPVRYIGNHSSGKMGIALADKAFEMGADVTLISTVKTDKPYKVLTVNTAVEMMETVKNEFISSDILVMAAAVADYRPMKTSDQKIKKENKDQINIELIKNPDILKEIAKIKTEKQIVVGFCAESENLISYAESKLKEKNLDFIAANDISNPEIGFNSDNNAVTLINKQGKKLDFPCMPKKQIAKLILEGIINE